MRAIIVFLLGIVVAFPILAMTISSYAEVINFSNTEQIVQPYVDKTNSIVFENFKEDLDNGESYTQKTAADLLMYFATLDRADMTPNRIKVNDTPIITIDDEFIEYKYENIETLFSDTGKYKFSSLLDDGTGNPEVIKSIDIEFEDKDTDYENPYYHIIIE